MKKILLAILLIFALSATAFAMDNGAYGVYCGTNYWNPDTNEIEDGGTANAALGEGMCRSATATTALVEKDGDTYYVTIRLLLQSNTKDAIFWRHTGYDTYEEVSYNVLAENAMEDSIDYRFAVADPFAPIKASMYVTPMGRSTVWFIELDESSVTSDTGDFVVSVSVALPEELLEETPVIKEEPVVEEAPDVGSDALVAPSPAVEETSELEETLEEVEVEEITEEAEETIVEEPVVEEVAEESAPEETVEEPVVEEVIAEEPEVEEVVAEVASEEEPVTKETSTNYTLYIVLAILVAGGVAFVVMKKGKKK